MLKTHIVSKPKQTEQNNFEYGLFAIRLLDSYNDKYLNEIHDYNYSIFNISIIVSNGTNGGSNDKFHFDIIGIKYDSIQYELKADALDTYTLQ